MRKSSTEKYHVREKIFYKSDGSIYSQVQVYFRVRDLVPVYRYLYYQNMGTLYDTWWYEFLNGGLVEH